MNYTYENLLKQIYDLEEKNKKLEHIINLLENIDKKLTIVKAGDMIMEVS